MLVQLEEVAEHHDQVQGEVVQNEDEAEADEEGNDERQL